MRTYLLLLVAAIGVPCLFAAEDKKAAPLLTPAADARDVQDLVYLADNRPVLLRLHVQVDGKPFPLFWERFMKKFFDYLDLNGDGSLSKQEVERAPKVDELRSLFQGGFFIDGGRGSNDHARLADIDTNKDGKVTLDEFSSYYRHTGFGPFQVGTGPNQGTSDRLTDGLFKHLDSNGDGKLSREEIGAATASLRKLDVDEDELITAQEIAPTLNGMGYYYVQQANRGNGPYFEKPGVIVLTPGEPVAPLVQHLLARYGKDQKQKLSAAEVAFDKATFETLDTNHDGVLDAVELEKWFQRPADMELIVRLGQNPDQMAARNPLGELLSGLGKALAPAAAVDVYGPNGKTALLSGLARREGPNGLVLILSGAHVALRRSDGPGFRVNGNRPFILEQFKALKADKKDYVEKKQALQSPYLQGLFNLADRDGDGKLYEKELIAYFDLLEKGTSGFTMMTLTDHGRGLFEILDSNQDDRLSIRELRTAWTRLAPYDLDHDGLVARTEIPRQVEFQFGQGEMYFSGRFAMQARALNRGGAPVATGPGPLWFRKMDRNGDGDVSLREFLGTMEDFKKIDTDGDGLIDAKEAEQADGWFRKCP